MFRRDFIRLLGLAPLGMLAPQVCAAIPAGLLAPKGLLAAGTGSAPTMRGPGARFLVLVELKGGNDGLNMVVPFADPAYYALRPRIGLAREQVLQLTAQVGFNPALQALMPLWQAGQLAVTLGVGYPEPNRSHFRSIEIWETASDSNEFLTQGWLTQLLAPGAAQRKLIADGVVLGQSDPGPLSGTGIKTIALSDPKKFLQEARRVGAAAAAGGNAALQHILGVQDEIHAAERDLERRLQTPPNFKTQFPGTQLGKQLQTSAQLLAARVPLSVIKMSLGSFDTHSNQRAQQDRLLKELAESLAAFRGAMQEASLWDQVLVMTYSEFGRRAGENGSQGTDHGTAAPHLLLGGKVKGGLYGEQPSLARLQNGDLIFKVDYRALYSTIATNWWGMPLTTANGHHFAPLDCIQA